MDFDVVINSLKENGVDFISFGGVESNPILKLFKML